VSSGAVDAPSRSRAILVPLSLAAVYLIWGSTYLALRYVIDTLPPLLSAGARYFTAGLVLFVFLKLRGAKAPTARQWLLSVPVGTLLFLFGNGFVALAVRDVASSVAAIACASMPLMAALLSAALGERSTVRQAVGLCLGFLGVVVMTAGDLRATPLAATLLLLAPLGWAIGSIVLRRADFPRGMMAAATQMMTGGVANAVVGIVRGERSVGPVTPASWAALGYLVVFGSLIAFSAYLYLLRTTTPPVAMSYAYVNPAVAVVLGAALRGERLTASTVLAGILVVAGVAIIVTSKASAGRVGASASNRTG
jgi:drug/metabolite transporter (DMT)-like permease